MLNYDSSKQLFVFLSSTVSCSSWTSNLSSKCLNMYQLQGEKKDNVINPKLKTDNDDCSEMIIRITADGEYFLIAGLLLMLPHPIKGGGGGGIQIPVSHRDLAK